MKNVARIHLAKPASSPSCAEPSAGTTVWPRCLWVLFFLATSSIQGAAQPITVEGSAHPRLSRLIMNVPSTQSWSLIRTGSNYRFELDQSDRPIQFEGAHNRLSNGRILELRSEAGVLQFEVGCACKVSVYDSPGGQLAIEVQGPPVRIGFARPRVLSDDIGAPGPEQSAIGRTLKPFELPFETSLGESTTGFRDPSLIAGRTATALPRVREFHEPPILPDSSLFSFGVHARISAATEALTDALDHAQDLGLVEQAPQGSATQNLAPDRRPPPGSPLPLPFGETSNLRVSTNAERDLARLASSLKQEAAGTVCLENYDLDVARWGDPSDPIAAIKEARGGVLKDFEVVNNDALEKLVKAYLFASFGAEARAVLEAFPIDEPKRAVFAFLAEVADGEVRPAEDEASALVSCSGPAAMWGLLSIADLTPQSDISKSEIAAAFSALPLHLRKSFGPLLVQRFLDLEDPASARAIWNAVDRATGTQSEEFVLATAALDAASGLQIRAERTYAELEGAGPGTAPYAVVNLIRSRLARSEPVSGGVLDTASTLSFENRGTPISRDLKYEELRGRISKNQWDLVFEELPRAEFSGALRKVDRTNLLIELYVAMSDRADVDAFVYRGFEANDRLPDSSAADSARRAVAKRLAELGFGGSALSLLARLAKPTETDREQLAEAELLMNRPDVALTHLEELSSDFANKLRGRAHLDLRAFDKALLEFQSSGEAQLAVATARRMGDWVGGNSTLDIAALRVARSALPPDTSELAGQRILADTAGELRQDIVDLRSQLRDPSASGF